MEKMINGEAAWAETCPHLNLVCKTAGEALAAASINVERVYFETKTWDNNRGGSITFVVRYKVEESLSPFELKNMAAQVQLILSSDASISQWFPNMGTRSYTIEDGGTAVEEDWENEWQWELAPSGGYEPQ